MAMAIGMGSCTNDLVEEVNPIMGKQDVITVNVGDESTRTVMDGLNVVWSEEDAIGIFAGSSNAEYSLSSGAGTTSAEFTGLAPQSLKEVAYFPYVANATWVNNVISTTLPSTYVYAEGTNNNAVMAALMADDAQSSISFQNAGALYAITVENIPAGYDKAVMTYLGADDNVGIAGNATITFVDGVPTLAIPEAANAASAQKTITITFTGTGNKTFYFPMPAIDVETFPGLQFSLQGEGKTSIKASAYTKEPQRNKFYAETLTLDNVSGGIVSEADDIAAANTELAKDAVTSVAVDDATADTPITIPAKSAESAAVEHTIDLSEATLPTTGPVEIVVTEGTGEKATVEKLTVIVPEGAEAGSYTINAPGTTVTIQGADGTVIETIEATTAENTLIIGEGVTIKNLTIKKGNVELKGNVGSIESEGATTITLGKSVTLTEAITISKGDVTFDLSANTLTASAGAFVVANGTLTVKDGTIDANKKGYDAIAIKGESESSVIVVNVESDATVKGGDCCVVVYGSNKSKDITINTAGTLVTESAYESSSYPGYAAISANANSEGVKMNVTGGSITAKVAAIYFPCETSLTISDGIITGATAVYQKSGELTISGGKLVGNGEKKGYVYNGNGCNETGDALVVESCNYPKGAPTISITGGEFVSTYASAIGSYIGNGATEKITGFVKGGTFHDASAFDYLADGASVSLGADITGLTKAITIPVGITATIDLNGFDITAPNTDAFEVVGTLTIVDENNEGVVTAGSASPDGSVCAVWANGGTVTINGGHYKVHADQKGERNDCIYAGYNADNDNTAGKIIINGGEFEYVWPDGERNYANEYNGDQFLLNCADKDLYETKITVNGGKFKNHVPGCENVTPAGRDDKEVVLGNDVKVYNNTTEVIAAHNVADGDIWYEVRK